MVLTACWTLSVPQLPPISAVAPPDPADKSVIEGNDCTFVSDFTKIQLPTNSDTLGERRTQYHETLGEGQNIE